MSDTAHSSFILSLFSCVIRAELEVRQLAQENITMCALYVRMSIQKAYTAIHSPYNRPQNYILSLLLNSERAIQPQIATTRANPHVKLSLWQPPLLRDNVPETQIPSHQLELHRCARARLEIHPLKPAQLPDRRAVNRDAHIQLRDLMTRHIARVLHLRGHGVHLLPQLRVAALHDRDARVREAGDGAADGGRGEGRVGEGGVRQPEAELVAGRDLVVVEGAVVDEEALGEVVLREGAGLGARVEQGAEVLLGVRDGVGEAAAGVDVAVEDVDEGVAGFLAGQAGEEDGCDVGVVDPGVDDSCSCLMLV